MNVKYLLAMGLPLAVLAGCSRQSDTTSTTTGTQPVAVALIAVAVLGAFRPTPWLETPILNGLRHPTRAYLFAADDPEGRAFLNAA